MKKLTTKPNWREVFKDCYKEDICVGLKIVPHSHDKKFPKGIVLRVETETEVFQEADNYKEGENGLRLAYLARLFQKMADQLLKAETKND